MRKATRNALTTTSLAATAVVAATAAALNMTWTFSPGGSVTATNVGNVVVQDMATTASISCTSSVAKATAKSGSGLSGDSLVTLDDLSLVVPTNPEKKCNGPSGVGVAVRLLGLPWHFDAESYAAGSGVTSGKMKGITVETESSDGCVATYAAPGGVPGQVDLTYKNSTSRVQVTGGNLTVVSVNASCDPDLIDVGDPINVVAVYKVGSAQTVTSP